jgi:hypothetical protein
MAASVQSEISPVSSLISYENNIISQLFYLNESSRSVFAAGESP